MLVSVIIPYFENKKFISKTINSVLNQSYKNLEIIIIFDEKNDFNYNFIKKFQLKDKRIKVFKNKQNIGAGFSRNVGINISKGNYVCFIDSDDIWSRHKVKRQLTFMKKRNIEISHTSYFIINELGQKVSSRSARDMSYKDLINSCDVGLSTVMVKKKILKKRYLFPNLKTKEDYVLWLKLTKNGRKIFAIKEKLSFWRNKKNSLSSSTTQKLKDAYKVYKDYEKLSLIDSFFKVINLSINYLLKKI